MDKISKIKFITLIVFLSLSLTPAQTIRTELLYPNGATRCKR